MKKTAIISTALCLSLMAAGCYGNTGTPSGESQASSDTGVNAVTETVESEITEASGAESVQHDVTVEVITEQTYSADTYELTSVVPKITVDGVEATAINSALSSHIHENYPMKIDGNNVDGFSTRIVWGIKDNTVSIVICASETFTDYYTREVFNYDLDTLTELDDHEVTKRLGMTDEEFFTRTTAIIEKYCENPAYDHDKSLADISYDKVTPFVLPDGTAGVLGCVVYSNDTQFAGSTSMRGFNMTTMEIEV